MIFAEIQFPPEISYGSKGGVMFSTDIVSTFSGHEQRNINWQHGRAKYDIATGVKTEAQIQEIISFFRARRGRAIGFRYKDWSDYRETNQLIGIGDGIVQEFQIIKYYKSGDGIYTRTINKPVNNEFCKIYIDSVLVEEDISIDFTTGKISFDIPPKQDQRITADFEFDVPVRFDTDHLDLQADSYGISSWQNIPLIEIRI